jgi:hypothetical protein
MPPGANAPDVYRLRGASQAVPDSINWFDGVKEAITVPPEQS